MINFAIPIALQIVIDDVGWWSGHDESEDNQPYRTGIQRHHVPEDYMAIAALGRKLNMRPQAAMILCEWDTTHSLKNLPTAQWMGHQWHNPWPIEPMQHAADILRNNTDCLELTLHGIGHEYWPPNGPATFTRAEWSDTSGSPRPREHVMGVLDAFARLMDQHNLGPFPTSFVPCAFAHGFNTDIARWLYDAGIRYLSTPFQTMGHRQTAQDQYFGIEHNILTVDRGVDGINWDVIEAQPDYKINGPIVGMHWSNILHTDPARNQEVVDRWVAMLKPYNDSLETMLAPDTASCFTQWVYHRKTRLTLHEHGCDLDFTDIDNLPACDMHNTITLKTNAPAFTHFDCQGVKLVDVSQGVLQLQRLDSVNKAQIRCSHPSE